MFESPSAYKVLEAKKAKSTTTEKHTKLDFDKLLKIYNECGKGKTGFIVRDKAYLKMLKKAEGLSAKQCIIDEEGYVLFRRERSGIWIRELVALNTKEMDRLIGLVEEKAKDLTYERTVSDEALLQVYKSRGYMIQKRSHWVMMIKPLTTDASFKQTYGDEFYFTGLDTF